MVRFLVGMQIPGRQQTCTASLSVSAVSADSTPALLLPPHLHRGGLRKGPPSGGSSPLL